MQKKKIQVFIFVLIALLNLFASISFARQSEFTIKLPPSPENSFVYDENRVMSQRQVQYFNLLSEELYQKTGVSVAIALMDDIGYADARLFAKKTADKWELGGTTNEGVLIFVAMKQRRRNVEVGEGAKEYLPDILVERLQQQELIPAFQKEKYGEGVLAFAYSIAQVIAHEKKVSLETDIRGISEEAPMTIRGWFFIALVFTLLVFAGVYGKKNGISGVLTSRHSNCLHKGKGFDGNFGCHNAFRGFGYGFGNNHLSDGGRK